MRVQAEQPLFRCLAWGESAVGSKRKLRRGAEYMHVRVARAGRKDNAASGETRDTNWERRSSLPLSLIGKRSIDVHHPHARRKRRTLQEPFADLQSKLLGMQNLLARWCSNAFLGAVVGRFAVRHIQAKVVVHVSLPCRIAGIRRRTSMRVTVRFCCGLIDWKSAMQWLVRRCNMARGSPGSGVGLCLAD